MWKKALLFFTFFSFSLRNSIRNIIPVTFLLWFDLAFLLSLPSFFSPVGELTRIGLFTYCLAMPCHAQVKHCWYLYRSQVLQQVPAGYGVHSSVLCREGPYHTGVHLSDETRCSTVFACMRAVLVLSYLSQFHSVDPEVEREKFSLSSHPIHVLPYMQQLIYRLIDLVDYSRPSVGQGCRYYFDYGTLILYDNHGVILS